MLLSKQYLETSITKSSEIKNDLQLVLQEFLKKTNVTLEEDIKKIKSFSLSRLALEEQKVLQEV